MYRPRNRQPRLPQSNLTGTSRPARTSGLLRGNANVPDMTLVRPGAAVSIVLKADQTTGRQVQGIVGEVLTSGNHPRGIKVRLRDGSVGRVQRMDCAGTNNADSTSQAQSQPSNSRFRMVRDVRLESEYPSEPPPRTFADFFPNLDNVRQKGNEIAKGHANPVAVTATCPICGQFEGDEIAVSRHVEQHLSES